MKSGMARAGVKPQSTKQSWEPDAMEGDVKCLVSSSLRGALEVTSDPGTESKGLNYSEITSEKAGLEKGRRIQSDGYK